MKKVSLLMTIAAALAVMAMAAVGCGTSGDNNNNQIKCTSDQMCNNGQVCDTVNKVCIAKCNKNSDCDSGVCVLGHCVPTTSDGDVDAFDNNESSTCTPGQQTCVGTSIFACINGSLQKQTDCATLGMVCTAGNCVNGGDTDAETPACTIDAKQCVVDKVYTCTASGWSQTEDCAASSKKCQNGACVAVATCTNNDKRCSGNIVETCTNNAWGVTTDCAALGKTCSNGQCVSGGDEDPEIQTCNNGDIRCVGNMTQSCSNGAWINGTDCAALGKTCSNGQCVGGGDPDVDNPVEVDNGTCTVGSTRCVGNGVFKCNSAGMWDSVEDCAASGKTCVDGACTGGSTNEGCASGTTCQAVSDGGAMGCLTSSGGLPSNAQKGCGNTPCTGNATCYCTESTCADANNVCIFNCGTCASGTTCQAVTDGGAMGCLTSSGGIPSNAQKGCGNNTPCTGNATCYCTESTCADANNVCIGNCSTL